ncbi:MAG: response regulator [Rhodospirillales bacterium]|nr:response regulator [Rhodospirillales bacterium]MCW8861365.1 response regulator [Rhodospirillales bacterium]MCW8952634.1 response regulator [Rhodospirillales bacterium]
MTEEKKKRSFKGVRALVVEDDPAGAKLITMVLNDIGIARVITAEDGVAAMEEIEKAGRNGFTLIICDWNMPRMSGLELLEKVRGAGINVPFVMITGRNTIDSAVDAKNMGVSAYLPKPYTPDQLARKIMEIIAPPMGV